MPCRPLSLPSICYERRPARFAHTLIFESKGQSKLIDLTRHSLKIARFSLPNSPSYLKSHDALIAADCFLGYGKFAVRLYKIPRQARSTYKNIRKTAHAFSVITLKWKKGEEIDRADLLKASYQLAYTVKKIISFVGSIFFKIAHFIEKHGVHNKDMEGINHVWHVLSAVKSVAKIYAYAGFLSFDDRKTLIRTAKAAIEVWKLIHTLLSLNGVVVHPYARLALGICKCTFGLFHLWIKLT